MRLAVKVSELQLWSLETGLQAKQIIKRDYNLDTARCDPSRVPAYLTPKHVVCTACRLTPLHKPLLSCSFFMPHSAVTPLLQPFGTTLSSSIRVGIHITPIPYSPPQKSNTGHKHK